MNINRHNYEEFFLMYVDNELTEVQRAEVDAFVKQNPDLLEELDMLKEATLSVNEEELPVFNKTSLYKNEQAIGLNNYEEYFLLHVDDELKQNEKEEVEKFVLQHPELQEAFTVLQQTKLQPEIVEFKNKEILYKKERKVIPINWFRMAAAAAVIGIITTLWITKDAEQIQPVAIINKAKNEPATAAGKQLEAPTPDIKVTEQPSVEKTKTPEAEEEALVKKAVTTTIKQPTIAPFKADKKKAETIDNGNLNNLPAPENNPVLAQNKQRVLENTSTSQNAINKKFDEQQEGVASYTNNNNASNEMNHQAVYKELDVDDEEDKSLMIGGLEINKNKLRGLFKKATNLFDKKGKKTESDRTIQIANFEIKTK